jgi:hypothetical protein
MFLFELGRNCEGCQRRHRDAVVATCPALRETSFRAKRHECHHQAPKTKPPEQCSGGPLTGAQVLPAEIDVRRSPPPPAPTSAPVSAAPSAPTPPASPSTTAAAAPALAFGIRLGGGGNERCTGNAGHGQPVRADCAQTVDNNHSGGRTRSDHAASQPTPYGPERSPAGVCRGDDSLLHGIALQRFVAFPAALADHMAPRGTT